MRAPSVSVVVPVFNAGVFLRPAIDSILGQTCGDFELLIVDDGGDDGSATAVHARRDPRIRVLDHGSGRPNRGSAASRNRAIAEARGEFVAFLNHDDTSRSDRLASQIAFLRIHPEIGLLGAATEIIDAEGARLRGQAFPAAHLGIRWLALLDCPMRLSSVMVRRGSFSPAALRFDEAIAIHADYEFIERLTRFAPAANLTEPLVSYRTHAHNNSRVHYAQLLEAGNAIAFAALRHELPHFEIAAADVALLRAVVLSCVLPGTRRSLTDTKRAWEVYFDLLESFREKYRSHPALPALVAATPNASAASA